MTKKSKTIKKRTGNNSGSRSPGLGNKFSSVIKDLFVDNKKQKIQNVALRKRRDSNTSDKRSNKSSQRSENSKIFEIKKQDKKGVHVQNMDSDMDQSETINVC